MFNFLSLEKVLAIVAALFVSTSLLRAQPKSLGVTQSFRGVWISYEHFVEKDCFTSADAGLLLSDLFNGNTKIPGYSARVNWNFIFYRKDMEDIGELTIFAGPGLSVGYDSDFKRHPGILFGVSGRLGLECAFPRRVTLTLSMCPILGSHVLILEDSVNMTFYKKGFMYGLLPEIGIKYNF